MKDYCKTLVEVAGIALLVGIGIGTFIVVVSIAIAIGGWIAG